MVSAPAGIAAPRTAAVIATERRERQRMPCPRAISSPTCCEANWGPCGGADPISGRRATHGRLQSSRRDRLEYRQMEGTPRQAQPLVRLLRYARDRRRGLALATLYSVLNKLFDLAP